MQREEFVVVEFEVGLDQSVDRLPQGIGEQGAAGLRVGKHRAGVALDHLGDRSTEPG